MEDFLPVIILRSYCRGIVLTSTRARTKMIPDPNPDRLPFNRFSRRDFLRTTFGASTFAASAVATGVGSLSSADAAASGGATSRSETLVKTLYESLTEAQRAKVCFPFNDPRRLHVNNNWRVSKSLMIDDFDADQRAMMKEIFMGVHNPEYAARVLHQVEDDNNRHGLDGSAIAIFGEPDSGQCEFVITCRHMTRRCDGDSVEGTAFGGPIFYGHAPRFHEGPDHEGNVYWYQALRAIEVFQMLDGKQRQIALLENGRRERGTETVRLTGKTEGLDGIKVAALSLDQANHVRKVIEDVLAPYRQADVAEAMKLIEKNGFENLHMAFYENGDLGDDRVWDVWQIEGPAALIYFRGSPHVHAWVHIKESAFEKGAPITEPEPLRRDRVGKKKQRA